MQTWRLCTHVIGRQLFMYVPDSVCDRPHNNNSNNTDGTIQTFLISNANGLRNFFPMTISIVLCARSCSNVIFPSAQNVIDHFTSSFGAHNVTQLRIYVRILLIFNTKLYNQIYYDYISYI